MGRLIKRAPALPFVKWAGGKRSIVDHLIARVPREIKTYYEPFLGGGALFFALASRKRRRFDRAYLSDTNVRLMRTYAAIAQMPNQVIARLEDGARHHSERHYEAVRSAKVDHLSDDVVAAWMIYLNKTCFNGLYRVNAENRFNVPMGKYAKQPLICDAKNLLRCAAVLSPDINVFTAAGDFTHVLNAKEGDFVYFDPPYYPLHAGSFTSYAAGFDAERLHMKLRDVALSLKRRGVKVLISNSDCPRVHALFGEDFTLEEVQAARSINSRGSERGKISDLLIS